MKIQHFVEIHLDKYRPHYNRGIKTAEQQNVDGHAKRRWQVSDDAQMAIHRRDFAGAAFLIGYAEAMSEYALRVRKHINTTTLNPSGRLNAKPNHGRS